MAHAGQRGGAAEEGIYPVESTLQQLKPLEGYGKSVAGEGVALQ